MGQSGVSSVSGGIGGGYRLKVDSAADNAITPSDISLTTGYDYSVKCYVYCALGESFLIALYGATAGATIWKIFNGLGYSTPVTVNESGTPSVSATDNQFVVSFETYGYIDNLFIGTSGTTINAEPITITSSISAYNVSTPEVLGNFYEETTKGIPSDLSVKTKDGIGTDILNIFRRKNTKYLWYDADTNGQDLVVSFYVDGVLQDETITINTTGRKRDRIDLWNMEGYRFAIKLNAQDVTERGMKIYSTWNIIYDYAGV